MPMNRMDMVLGRDKRGRKHWRARPGSKNLSPKRGNRNLARGSRPEAPSARRARKLDEVTSRRGMRSGNRGSDGLRQQRLDSIARRQAGEARRSGATDAVRPRIGATGGGVDYSTDPAKGNTGFVARGKKLASDGKGFVKKVGSRAKNAAISTGKVIKNGVVSGARRLRDAVVSGAQKVRRNSNREGLRKAGRMVRDSAYSAGRAVKRGAVGAYKATGSGARRLVDATKRGAAKVKRNSNREGMRKAGTAIRSGATRLRDAIVEGGRKVGRNANKEGMRKAGRALKSGAGRAARGAGAFAKTRKGKAALVGGALAAGVAAGYAYNKRRKSSRNR